MDVSNPGTLAQNFIRNLVFESLFFFNLSIQFHSLI